MFGLRFVNSMATIWIEKRCPWLFKGSLGCLSMRVLIVETNPELGRVWARHLERVGAQVVLSSEQQSAIGALQGAAFDVIILDLVIDGGSAFAIADLASYRQPDAKIIFVTNSGFFSDGSVFQLCANACALVPPTTSANDLAALVEHHSMAATASRP
jgi:CheY-like chemotaxis protein